MFRRYGYGYGYPGFYGGYGYGRPPYVAGLDFLALIAFFALV